MEKYITMVFVFLSLLVLASCANKNAALGEPQIYEVTSDIHSLHIQINAADFTIEHGEQFSVESNLKNLSVSEKDGVLTIIEKTKPTVNHTGGILKLCIPDNTVFEDADITTGAAKLTADSLSANSLELKLGAGKVQFGCLNAYSSVDMEGGAGEITIISGTLNNLTLTLGVGELNMTAALLGESDLKFGIGESNLTLIGSKDNYKLDIEKGIGRITIDEKTVSGSGNSGNSQYHVKIEGGIGAANVAFQEE